MGVITSSTTVANAVPFPAVTALDRQMFTNTLWAIVWTATSTFTIYKSTDGGVSWTASNTISRANVSNMGEMRLDNLGEQIHWSYITNESSYDKVWYRRIDVTSGTAAPAAELLVHQAGNGGVALSTQYQCGIYPARLSNNTYKILVPVAFHGSYSGVNVYGVVVGRADQGYPTSVNAAIIGNNAGWSVSGNDSSFNLSIDVEHGGNGLSISSPSVWITWQTFTTLYAVKLSWQGVNVGWLGPTNATTIMTGLSVNNRDAPCRWNGWLLAIVTPNASDPSKLNLIDRDQANTYQDVHTSPSHPQGAVTTWMLSHNDSSGDPRLYAVGTSTAFTYYIDYVRDTDTWGTWTLAYSTTAARTGAWGVRRSTAGDSTFDYYQEEGASSPYTVRVVPLGATYTPNAPTWIVGAAGTVTVSGAAFDVSSSLTLDWAFNSPSSSDTQGSFALSRQIGTGTVQWWRTSDSTWQTVETQNTSASTAVTLTTAQWLGAGGASDPAHTYKVKTWNSSGLASAYSDPLGVVPSTRVDPTLTHPSSGENFTVNQPTVTWTVSEQSAYRVTITNTATSAVVLDSGWLTDPGGASPSVLSYQVPITLANGFAGTATLQTKNVEGLASVVRSNTFTVNFVEPVNPIISTLTADPAAGGIDVTTTQAAATGTQPVTSQVDLWRRAKSATAVVMNSNPFFETNASDWSGSNGTVAQTTAQAHQGTGSLLLTPNGTGATPFAQSGLYAVTAGASYEVRAWLRPATANKGIRLYLSWYDNTSTLISSVTKDLTPVAGVWVYATVSGSAPSNATQARIAAGLISTPAGTDTLYIDEATLRPYNADPGIRIGANITTGAVVLDWRAVTGIDYEYQAVAYGSNGSHTAGPWNG